MRSQLLFSALLPLASAHFKLVYPAARGFDEDILSTFPCGGQDAVSSNRTQFPMSGAPIQLLMGHTSAKVQVLLGLGNDPGSNFNITLVPTFQEQGPENFCINGNTIHIPDDVKSMISEGTNATIQVITNGDPSGGLYNCADITFTQASLSTEQYNSNCANSTGVTASALTNAGNANGSSSDASPSSSATSAASSGASSAAVASSTSAAGAAALPTIAGYAIGAMGVLAGIIAL
ncbi:hypothetical protein AAFC00_003756 [Neodothiora populina]|uniref:Copper acquisition factor BIM1-like domain-containing protein n=1 Tax=Neodothiora populina TaxID=2781224 RepID=A0ABR3PFE0_9PEZI